MRLAARAPPPPHFVAWRLWRLTSFCERQIVDRSFEVSVRLHNCLQRFLQFLADLGGFLGLRRSADSVVRGSDNLHISMSKSCPNLGGLFAYFYRFGVPFGRFLALRFVLSDFGNPQNRHQNPLKMMPKSMKNQ